MKLHRNQYCPIHHSRACCCREEASKARHLQWVSSESTTQIIREDTGNFAHLQNYGKCSPRKSLRRKETAESVTCRLPTARTLSPTTSSPRVWERHGAMTTQTTFRRRIGSATSSRVQAPDRLFRVSHELPTVDPAGHLCFRDGSLEVIIARKPLEALIADWLRQGEEIHRLQTLVAKQTCVCHRQSLTTPSDQIC